MDKLQVLLYSIAIYLYQWAIYFAAPFSPKAKQWVEGRKHWRQKYAQAFQKTEAPVLWLHAASLGEFEQGRPLLEAFRAQRPEWRIVLTFFSPSGFEIRKNYPHADFIAYLPADTPANAADFLDIVRPDICIIVKYEFWANYLFELKRRGVRTLLVSALFRPEQPFFRFWGGIWRKMLGCFNRIYVQNEASAVLLQKIGITKVEVAGDTRIDRVLQIAESAPDNAVLAQFTADKTEGERILIAGSTWQEDEKIIAEWYKKLPRGAWRLVIAPHQPSAESTSHLKELFGEDTIPYSEWENNKNVKYKILIINNIGLLNTLYKYGDIAYVGGGFGKGIHNTLEPAAFGLPVLFGPEYKKFDEARAFLEEGGGFALYSSDEMKKVTDILLDSRNYERASTAVKSWLLRNCGAVERIIAGIA